MLMLDLCSTKRFSARLQRVGGRGGRDEVVGVSLDGTAPSADLGSSSKYSSEILEDRSG